MQRVAERVLSEDDPIVHLPQHVEELRDAARAAASGDPAARRKYEQTVERWSRRVEALGQGAGREPGAHTVRSSTQRLITELREAQADQVDAIVDRWVLDRARYQARQIARHETVEAYRDGYKRSTEDNPAVVGYRWTLSPRHPRPDICDLYANQNLYGLGPGGYPPGELPATPHPNCLCVQTAIVDRFHTRRELARLRGEPEPPREWEVGGHETAAEWLAKQPDTFQQALLGSTRARVFREAPERVISARGAPIPVHQVLGIPKRTRCLGLAVSARRLVEADRARMVQPFPEVVDNRLLDGVTATPTRSLETHRRAFEGLTAAEATEVATGQRPPVAGARVFEPITIEDERAFVNSEGVRGKVVIGDGNHRLAAAKEAGATAIRARVRTYDASGNVISDEIRVISLHGLRVRKRR